MSNNNNKKEIECNDKCKDLGTHGHCNVCGKLVQPLIECKCEFRNTLPVSDSMEDCEGCKYASGEHTCNDSIGELNDGVEKRFENIFGDRFMDIARMADKRDDTGYGKGLARLQIDIRNFIIFEITQEKQLSHKEAELAEHSKMARSEEH